MTSYYLELKTSKTSFIKTIIDTINSLVIDLNISFYSPSTPNGGIHVNQINKTGKILIQMLLNSSNFEIFNYNYPEDKLTISIDINNLSKCLKCVSQYDIMTWLLERDDMNRLIIILESLERKEKKIFKLNLMDVENDEIGIADVEFPYTISIPSQDFHKYCKDMALSTDKIDIRVTSNKLFFSGKGEIGQINFEIEESPNGVSIQSNTNNINEIVQGLYELKYLLIFTKCSNLSNNVILQIKNCYPLVITYNIANLGRIKLILSRTSII